jgi:hypothetical protein
VFSELLIQYDLSELREIRSELLFLYDDRSEAVHGMPLRVLSDVRDVLNHPTRFVIKLRRRNSLPPNLLPPEQQMLQKPLLNPPNLQPLRHHPHLQQRQPHAAAAHHPPHQRPKLLVAFIKHSQLIRRLPQSNPHHNPIPPTPRQRPRRMDKRIHDTIQGFE